MSRITEPLTDPTSETIAPGARWGAISCATAPQAPTGMQTMTRSAFLTARGLIMRQVGAYQLPNALRMSVGTEEANRLVVQALAEFLGSKR